MALVRRTIGKHRAGKAARNRAKVEATIEADIRRHTREDDQEETGLRASRR
jgi:hypothetical protein